ncbi:MAG: IS630 family transposase [Myxococcales bacterium]|nr:IS630 family transposase [Myxococcales bacterium]
MGPETLAPGKKNAARLNAWLVFIDETGFLTSPLVRRSWAPRGSTPVLVQRLNSRQKASAVGALAISPRQRKVRLLISYRLHQNFNTEWAVGFLRDLRRHLGSRLILVWDNLNVHRSLRVRALIDGWRHARLEFLPPYAPELNPLEYVWGYLKLNPLANLAPDQIDELVPVLDDSIARLQTQQQLLRSFIRASPLSFSFK